MLATRNAFDDFQILDVYAKGEKPLEYRPDAIATISAGSRNDKGLPQVSRDGKIILHDAEGRAPGLKKMLLANGEKVLTITPAFDNPADFLQMRFMRYSASKLEAYGDANQITEIKMVKGKPEHVTYQAGTPEYESIVETCKVSCSLYFYLAYWIDDMTGISLDDGLGFYRLRFTSRNSLNNILASLKTVAKYSQGRVSGVPFDLMLVNREVADPSGAKRKVPVWTMTMKKPGGLALDSRTFRQALESGIKDAQMMQLEPPKPETIEIAMLEPDVDLDSVELSDDDARMLETGIDYKFRLKQWFMAVRGTILDSEQDQHDFLTLHTAYSSRQDAAKYLEQADWDKLLERVALHIAETHKLETEAKADADLNDPDKYRPEITQEHISSLNKLVTSCDIPKTQALDFIGWLAQEMLLHKHDISPETVLKAEAKVAEFKDVGLAVCDAYRDWCQSDDAAGDVLA